MYSSREVCRLTGVTFRQLDYWTRLAVIVPATPANGSGSSRRWSAAQVCVVALLRRLASLNAPLQVLGRVAEGIADLPADQWKGQLVVHEEGAVWIDGPLLGAAWVVDLGACAKSVEGHLVSR